MSNLESLVGDLTDAVQRYTRHNSERIQAALDAGYALLRIKESNQHGAFLPTLESLDLHEKTAERWMLLAKAGLKSDTVSNFNTLTEAYKHARQVIAAHKAALAEQKENDKCNLLQDQIDGLKVEHETCKAVQADLTAQCDYLRAALVEEHGEAYVIDRERQFEAFRSEIQGQRASIDEWIGKHKDLQGNHKGALKRIRELEAA